MSTHQLAALARTAEPRLMLRRFLALDAAVTGANALAYLALSGPLGDYLGAGLLAAPRPRRLPRGLRRVRGPAGGPPPAPAARRPGRRRGQPGLGGRQLRRARPRLAPTTAGVVWTVLQAAVVTGFALLQYGALRQGQDSSE
ncbi:hypothetical protein SVIOM342S_08965 [Streptomyces violaceorubidus]